jgi:hypothetical protein
MAPPFFEQGAFMNLKAINGAQGAASTTISGESAAFIELTKRGIIKSGLPATVNGGNWLKQSPVILKDIDEATASLLAAKGAVTVAHLVLMRDPPTGTNANVRRTVVLARLAIDELSKQFGFEVRL